MCWKWFYFLSFLKTAVLMIFRHQLTSVFLCQWFFTRLGDFRFLLLTDSPLNKPPTYFLLIVLSVVDVFSVCLVSCSITAGGAVGVSVISAAVRRSCCLACVSWIRCDNVPSAASSLRRRWSSTTNSSKFCSEVRSSYILTSCQSWRVHVIYILQLLPRLPRP